MSPSAVGHRSPGFRILLAAVLGLALIVLAPPPAKADLGRADFLHAAKVKASMKGKGKWHRGLGEPNFVPLGATPADCRSDLPYAAATESRSAWYGGAIAGKKRYSGQAVVHIYRFTSPAVAADALAAASEFVTACPRSYEWVCENCDGAWTYIRKTAAPRRVGTESIAWKQRSLGLGQANGRVIAARSGSVIVVAEVSHVTDPEYNKKPPAPTWKRTKKVAKKALARATR